MNQVNEETKPSKVKAMFKPKNKITLTEEKSVTQRTGSSKLGSTKMRTCDFSEEQPVNLVQSSMCNEHVDEATAKITDQLNNNTVICAYHQPVPVEEKELPTNLLINYLPPSMTQQDLRNLCSPIGTIVSCKLVINKFSFESLGYGFIKYSKHIYALNAIDVLNGLKIQNKVLKVSFARPNSRGKSGNLYIKGLPMHTTESDLRNLFSPYGSIISIRVLYSNNHDGLLVSNNFYSCAQYTEFQHIANGTGFVRFDQRADAERAIEELNGTMPPGFTSELRVKFARNRNFWENMRVVQPRQTNMWSLNNQIATVRNTRYNTQNYSSREIVDYPICSQSQWCIFIYNLGNDVGDIDLWELFGPFGAVQNVTVMRNDKNQSRGYGFVNMTHFSDASLAITQLDGYLFRGRVLQVSFKRYNDYYTDNFNGI